MIDAIARYPLPVDWRRRCRTLQRNIHAFTDRELSLATGRPRRELCDSRHDATAYTQARGLAHTAIACYPDLAPGEPMRY